MAPDIAHADGRTDAGKDKSKTVCKRLSFVHKYSLSSHFLKPKPTIPYNAEKVK